MRNLTRRHRITIVDDQRDFLDLMRLILEPRGHLLTCIAEGATLDLLVQSQPDLLVIDLRLGQPANDLSGWELVVLASHHRSLAGVPIVICSADLAEMQDRTAELGESDRFELLAKPFDVEEAEQLVDRLLVRRDAVRLGTAGRSIA
jgi:CheY-like chemotaxis protein